MKKMLCALLAAPLLLAGCGERGKETAPSAAEAPALDASALLDAAIASSVRTEAERARDGWRHPKETLQFFGVAPSMTVVEVWPGGGWYTKILAPYLKSGGVYYAALADPSSSERAAASVERFKSDFADAAQFGEIRITALGAGDIAPEGSADVVLTFRNVHNWLSNDAAEENFKAFYKALKPGGVLGVVEHRANDGAGEDDSATGYVKESTVKALAAAAGFEFAGASEINANPADAKDHPFGVWTLPPVRRSSASPGQEDPAFDRAKYDAIGESDRMTLKFIKPLE
ncbi:MAG: class I SAM-dependent methyltransferase [Pseudomonadota bacterium]